MQLVFIHGWGFDARFWDAVCELIPQIPQRRIDRGYFGNPSAAEIFGEDGILVGHSLGFMHGFMRKKDWRGWIAVNGFPRFVPDCVSAVQLREMKMGLAFAAPLTLRAFYARLGAEAPQGSPDTGCLRAGLEELQEGDILADLEKLEAPGLVLAARNDPLVPVGVGESLGRVARRGGILWHEGGGHILPLSDPQWCAQAIENFTRTFSG